MDISIFKKSYQRVANFVEGVLFVDSFRERIVQFEPKIFFYSYTFYGGFLFDERIRKNARKVCMIYYYSSSVVVLAFSTSYLSDLMEKDFCAIVFGVLPIITVSMRMLYLCPIYYYRKEIVILVDYFMDKFKPSNGPASYVETLVDGINTKKWTVVMITYYLVSYFLIEAFLDMGALVGRHSYNGKFFVHKYFPVWFPFGNSPLARLLLYLFQSFMFLPLFVAFMGGFAFILMFIVEMHNEFIALGQKLRSISAKVFEGMDRLEKMEEEAMKVSESFLQWTADMAEKERARIMEIFLVELTECVEQYQRLRRIAELAKTYLEVFNSVTYSFTLFNLVFIGFLLSLALDDVTGAKEVMVFVAFGLSFSVLYMSCILGEMFKGMNETFVEEVYSTPWYYLQPKNRKLVLVFLGLAQRSLGMRVLKIVTLARNILPKYLDSVKSYTQIMLLCYRRNKNQA